PRRSVIQACNISSSSRFLVSEDSTSANRQGVVWCGAGAVTALATALRTSAGSTGSSVKERTVRRAGTTSRDPYRNRSSSAGRTSAAAPGPSSSVTRCASPEITATGTTDVLPLTISPALATSSACALTVVSMIWPWVSVVLSRSSSAGNPATPMATSV